eukprot:gene14644-biopygen181
MHAAAFPLPSPMPTLCSHLHSGVGWWCAPSPEFLRETKEVFTRFARNSVAQKEDVARERFAIAPVAGGRGPAARRIRHRRRRRLRRRGALPLTLAPPQLVALLPPEPHRVARPPLLFALRVAHPLLRLLTLPRLRDDVRRGRRRRGGDDLRKRLSAPLRRHAIDGASLAASAADAASLPPC